MSGHERPSRLNRALLAATGLLLLACAGFALGTRFAVLDVLPPDGHLLPGDPAPPTWVWYATAACGVVLGLLALRWLVAQVIREPKAHQWRFDTDTGRTGLAASTATAPLLAETETYPGVLAARGTLAGTRANPALALVITTEQDAEPGAIRHALAARGVPRLRRALDLEDLPTTVEFRFTGEAGPRLGVPTADPTAQRGGG
ncbi:alkaline shock response membrane anchor protein AmaP [Actinokineospora diospyrosa]|uniref:Alkaline shock response membrane anchor protein AmaP n=1 Tax=Actinokineospora diospyrosa TaxID=103728 RepID=A0ABT1IER1_9PSEU|nr:alkaline shock response membrane anchor protein AmaP [Actinokineospora diospyrosa]MCP2271118.1 hypothetical protein [Actinokineospora diospyrosa]